jgi:hypothetical protein
MANRSSNLQKQLKSRVHGLMKKGNELNRRYGVRVALLVKDGLDIWTFQSESTWPEFFSDYTQRGSSYNPSDFMTLSEYQKASGAAASFDFTTPQFSSPDPQPVPELLSEDLALLQAFNSGYPIIESGESRVSVTNPALSEEIYINEVNGNSKRSPRRTSDLSVKRPRKEKWSSKPVTRSVAKTVHHHDPYNFTS